MDYKILFSKQADKQFSKLTSDKKNQILKYLEKDSLKPEKKYVGTPFFIIRIGDYRLIVDVNENKIFIVSIKHRKNVYD